MQIDYAAAQLTKKRILYFIVDILLFVTGKSFSKLTTFPFLSVKETLFLSFEKQFFRC